jgi:purine-nucleoside phosphorylase
MVRKHRDSARHSTVRSEFTLAERAAKFILSRTQLRPKIAVVLGSGLGGFADSLTDAIRIPFEKIPGFPPVTVQGHAGRLVLGKISGVPVAVMQGRPHLYEGYSAQEIAFPMRAFFRLGIHAVILTNAAGAIESNLQPGALVLIRDHINLQGANPLTGANDARFGPRFPGMSQAYAEELRAIALAEAKRLGIALREGVYAALSGPSYETPAEIRFLRTAGADLVGMSTVPEVIAAQHMGMQVLAISCVANAAADVEGEGIHHADVLAAAERAQSRLTALLTAVIPKVAALEQQKRQKS